MDSIVARRSDSHAMSRKAGNSPRRQLGSAIASSSSTYKAGFPSQKTPYNTRHSLSRSYDSPEGIHRISQAFTKKSAMPNLRRCASPPASSSAQKCNSPGTGRNQTILDDAAWMTQRIQNLQKTGFLRYPSTSKLRDSSHIFSSLQSLSADYEEMSCFSSSPIGSSNSLQNQTAIAFPDEPLSAFRLSEVTLSEEDLLTDFSSTCNSTPVSRQSGCMLDRTARDYYQGTSLAHNAELTSTDYYQGTSFSHNAEQTHGDVSTRQNLAASSKTSPLNIRGDLLDRLEALRHRAELATKVTPSNHFNCNQYSKDPRDGQVLLCNEDLRPSSLSQGAILQGRGVLSATASPNHSTIEATSWQAEEQEKYSDSTCWLHEEVKTQPYVRHLLHSSSRIIRPEYYLPLSKEEEPAQIPLASSLLSPNKEQNLASKDDNLEELALQRLSPLRQRRAEDISPGRCLGSHKKTQAVRKSRRSLGRSLDTVNRSVMARSVISVSGFSSTESCPSAAREAHSRESKSISGYNNSTNLIQGDESFDTEIFPVEKDDQRRHYLENEVDYDGEVSWISEENVEGFLRSRCFVVDQLAASNNSGGIHNTRSTSPSLASGKLLQIRDKTESPLYCYKESLLSPDKGNGYSQEKTSKCIIESMEKISTFDNCKQSVRISDCKSTINNQTSSHCQLSKGGTVAHAHPHLPEFNDTQNLVHRPVNQVCRKTLESDLSICCKTIPENKHAKGSQDGARTKEQPTGEEISVWFSAVDSDKAQSALPENEQQVQVTELLVPFHFEKSSADNSITSINKEFVPLDTAISSPEIHVIENQHWPVVAKSNEKAPSSLDLSERASSHIEQRNFLKIARSLSFSDKEMSELAANTKQNKHNGLNELKSTSFSHYWIRNSAYSLDVSELLNNVTKSSSEPDEVNLATNNFDKMLHGSKMQETSGSMEQEPLKEVLGISDMANEDGGICATLCMPNICVAASENATVEGLVTRLMSSQQCCQLQLDYTAETLCRSQDDSRVGKVVEDKDCWQQFIVSNQVSKDAAKPEMYEKVILHETLNKGKDVGTQILSKYKNEPEQIELKELEGSTLSEQHISKASINYQNKTLISEDTMKSGNNLGISGSPNLQEGETSLKERVMKTPSILSVYKNPLWLDESSSDLESHHTCQDQEFLDFTYCSERSIGFLDSGKRQLSFSQKFDDKTWDMYEGMGAYISSFPDSPCRNNKEKVSEASDNFLPFAISSDLDSLIQCKIKKKPKNLYEEVENGNLSVCEFQVSENCSTSNDIISCELAGFDAKQKVSGFGQAAQHQLASRLQATIKSDLTSQAALSSNSLKVLSIADDNCNNLSLSSSPRVSSERCLQLKDISATHAKNPVSLENCSSEQVFWPDSTYLSSKDVSIQDVAIPARRSTEHDLLHNAPLTDNTTEESLLPSEIPCQPNEAKSGEAIADYNSKIEQSRQEPFASIKAPGVDHLYLLDNELSTVNATKENQSLKCPIMLSNDEMEASEEVKRVTFVYSNSTPHKNANAALPEVLSLFSSPTKGGEILRKTEQKLLLKQGKLQEDQTDLNRLGGKVEALEAEIDNFKRENKKLRYLVKYMIKKIQQGFGGRKRRGATRGFMTCIYSVRVQRSKAKISRKSR